MSAASAANPVEEEEHKEMELEEEEPLFSQAMEIVDSDPKQALKLFTEFVDKEDPNGKLTKLKEQAVYKLCEIHAKNRDKEALKKLFVSLRPFFNTVAKAKTAKIVRGLIDLVGKQQLGAPLQAELCEDAIAWCRAEGRTFLRQRLQTRLVALYLKLDKFKEALGIIARVLREVKKFDDKLLMVEIQLLESCVHLALQNVPKAKGALTAARSAANAVYCPPLLQAQIDQQAGTLCADEKDFKTAFSYFYEGFEGYSTLGETENAIACLKYMLLVKIMMGLPEDAYAIINGKAGIKYAGIEVEALKHVADAYTKRSIQIFDQVYAKYHQQLAEDPVIARHLSELKNNLLMQNLIKIIQPFSRVEIAHVAKLIKLPLQTVEAKLSEMILDKQLRGILDQGTGHLVLFTDTQDDKTYSAAVDTIKELSTAVDRLYVKGKKLAGH